MKKFLFGLFSVLSVLPVLLLALSARSISAVAGERQLRIQDLTATEERGIPAEEMRVALSTSSTSTYPNQIISGNQANTYISGSNPNTVTQGNSPNFYTHGNMPDQLINGRTASLDGAADKIPMPNLNF